MCENPSNSAPVRVMTIVGVPKPSEEERGFHCEGLVHITRALGGKKRWLVVVIGGVVSRASGVRVPLIAASLMYLRTGAASLSVRVTTQEGSPTNT